MSFPYPEKPWVEGQTHEVAMGDGTYLLGQYNEEKNLWSFRRLRDDQVNRERVFTFDVYTSVSQPAPREKSPFDISDPLNMQTQQDVNWFLWQEILKLTAGNTAIWIDNIEQIAQGASKCYIYNALGALVLIKHFICIVLDP